MSSSKKGDLQRDLAAGVYQSDAQNPIPPTHCILIHTGKVRGGGELNQRRRLERQQFTKLDRSQSINSDKLLPQSPFTDQLFLDDDILLWCL